MGLFDNLLGSVLSGQNTNSGIGAALLSQLASESGRTGAGASAEPLDSQQPAAVSVVWL